MTELAAQLARHVPADEHEARALARIAAHVAGGGALFRRDRWDGHLTGSAFVLDADGLRLLLLFHRKLERWLQPGGHGEPDETDPAVVAAREALEETGIVGLALHPTAPRPFDLDVHLIPARKGEPAHEHLDVRYLFVAPRGARTRVDEAESSALAWVSLDEAAVLGDESVVRAIQKIRALLSGADADQQDPPRAR